MREELAIAGLTFEIHRSPRRRTLGMTVERSGKLVLHAPEAAASDELAAWARSKLLWVHRKLALKDANAPRVREPEFVAGESFSYLGRTYRLTVVTEQQAPLRFDGHHFSLRRDERAAGASHFRRWYIAAGKAWIARRVALLAERAGTRPSRIDVRDLGFRWGSCGRNGAVFFNWRLLQLPVRLADYVIVHEMCHLREPHHGGAFWALLDRSLPDRRDREEELRERARDVYWCHAQMAQ